MCGIYLISFDKADKYILLWKITDFLTMSLKQYTIYVKTGDKKFAGTDANVYIILCDSAGNRTKSFHLDKFFRDDFERGNLDDFVLEDEVDLCDIDEIELWRDNYGFGDEWFVDFIQIHTEKSVDYSFPMFKWIKANYHYKIKHLDTSIPQFDPYQEQRENELLDKQMVYQLCQKAIGLPAQVSYIIDIHFFPLKLRDLFPDK